MSINFLAQKAFDRTERYVYICSEKTALWGNAKNRINTKFGLNFYIFKITNVCDQLDFRNRRYTREYPKKKIQTKNHTKPTTMCFWMICTV